MAAIQGSESNTMFALINRVCNRVQFPTGLYSALESDGLFIQNIRTIIELSETRLSEVIGILTQHLDAISKNTITRIVSLSNVNNTNINNIGNNPIVDEPINEGEYLQAQLFILKLMSACLYYNWNNLYADKSKRRNDELNDPSIPVKPHRGRSVTIEKKPPPLKEIESPFEFDDNLAKYILSVVIRFFQTSSTQIISDNITHNTFNIQTSNENPSISSCIPEFKSIYILKEVIANIVNFPVPSITSYDNTNMASLEIFKEIQKYAGRIIFYLSASNWVPIFQRIKSRLVCLAFNNNSDMKTNNTDLSDLLSTNPSDIFTSSNGAASNIQINEANSTDLTELRLLEWLCLNRNRLFALFNEFISCFKWLKKTPQIVAAILLRKAIWNWIIVHPIEFGNLWKEPVKVDSGPEKLFDVIANISDNSKKKALFWPLQTMLLIISPDSLYKIGVNDVNVSNSSLAKKAAFLEMLRKSLKSSRLSDVAAFSYVDICRASTFVSKTDGSALRLLVPNIENELKERLFDISRANINQPDSIIDQQLLIDCLTSLLKLNLTNALGYLNKQQALVPTLLQDNVPFYYKIVLVKSYYSIASERYQLPWNPPTESVLLTICQPLRSLFLNNIMGENAKRVNYDKKQKRFQIEEFNEKVEIVSYILKIWNLCPYVALAGNQDVKSNSSDISRVLNGLTACALDTNVSIGRYSCELLKKLFLPENIEQWDGSSRIELSVAQQNSAQDNNSFNAIPIYVRAYHNESSSEEQNKLMINFWKLSSQVILNVSKQLLDTRPDVDPSILQIVKTGLKLLKSLLLERNNYLSIHRNHSNQGIGHGDRYSCGVVLEIALLVFLCSSDTEISYISATCFDILTQEAILTGEMDKEDLNSKSNREKNSTNENEFSSHLKNLNIYRNIIQQLNIGVVTSQKVQQKRIRNVLRNIDSPTVGIMGAYEEIYRRWYKLTGYITIPRNKNIQQSNSNFGSPILPNGNWDDYYNNNFDEIKKKGSNPRYQIHAEEYIFAEDKGEWKNYTGFLCVLGGCCFIAGQIVTQMVKQGKVPQSSLSKGINNISFEGKFDPEVFGDPNYLALPSIARLYSNGYDLIDKFVHALVDLLGSDNVMVRESVKELLGNELNTLLYSNFLRCLDLYMKRSFFDEKDNIICSEKNTTFIENAISIFRCLVDRDDTTDYFGSMDLASLIITFIRYVDRLSEAPSQYNTALRIKVRITQLCDSIYSKKEFSRLCNSVKFRNKLVESFVGWINDKENVQGERVYKEDLANIHSTSKESKLHIDLDISCMKTITVLLVQLPLQPEDAHEATIEEEKTRLFNKYFQFFITLLRRSRLLEIIESGDYRGATSELSNLLSKSKDYVRWMGPLKDYSILALSNLLSSNLDIGLKYSLPLGYHEDTKTRAAFMQIFTNILNQVSDFEDLLEENKEKVMIERYKKLIDLFTENDLTIALALCEVAPVGDIDEIAQLILAIIRNNRELTLKLIKIVVKKEVNKTESPANLFRRNSMATRLLTIFAKYEGSYYLKRTLQPYLIKLVADSVDKSYEIDPTKIQYGDKDSNIENLKNACQGFVDVITNSQGIPSCFIDLCTFIAEIVEDKFHGSHLQAVGGFIFLRFFCPAIVSPDELVAIPQSAKELRRGLVLCTKVIQNLANHVSFGVKETFMIELNGFLNGNFAPVQKFLMRISGLDGNLPEIDDQYYGKNEAQIEPNSNVVYKLHYYLVENQEKIERVGKEMISRKSKHSKKNTLYGSNQNVHSSQSSSEDIRDTKQLTQSKSNSTKNPFEQFTSLINQLGPAPEISETQSTFTYIGKAGVINQLFIEFLQRNEHHRNLDAVKDSKVFYEGGTSKERNPVFYLIARRVPSENDDMELLLYYIFTLIKPYFGRSYEIVIDCSFFDIGNEIKSNYWLNILPLFPPEAFDNLARIYLYNVTTVFKKWSKQFAKSISSRVLKKMVCVNYGDQLPISNYISYSELKLPKSTILLEKDIITSFSPVTRITHYKSRNQVNLKINKDSIIITTSKKQELFGIPCIFNDVIPISEIVDILYSSDPDDESDFVIRYGQDKRMQSFSSPKRDQIFTAIRASRSRFQYSRTSGMAERILRPGDVPGTILNMALLNAGSEDATLRLSAYNLLYTLSLAFSFDVDNQLLGTKGLCIPSNNINFIINISEKLARNKPELTLELLLEAFEGMKKSSNDLKHYCLEYISPWIPNLALYANPGSFSETDKNKEVSEKLEEILRQFIDLSITENDMYASMQIKIWKVLGEVEEIVSQVIDVLIQKALEHGPLTPQSEVVCNTIVSYASSNVQLVAGKIISKLRKKLKVSSFNGAVSLTDHPEWDQLTIMIRLILMLSFSNNVFVQQYLPELFHIVTMFVGVGTPLIRASIHGLVVNLIHSMCINLSPESETFKNLSVQLSEFVEQKCTVLFGLSKGSQNAFTNISEAMSDPYEGITLSALEMVSTTLLNIMTYGAPTEEISATWKSRWMSLITSTAFQYNPALQPRAFVAMGCLARDEVDDDLLYQILVALRNALALYDQTECTYIISIIMCLTNVIENLPLDSRYMSSMFWLGMALIQIGNIPLFQGALNLLQVVLRTLEANECFVDETVSSYLLKAREPLTDIVIKMDEAVGTYFSVNFPFAVSTNLIKGLRHPATKSATVSLLMTFLEISSKACGGACIGANNTVGPELIGYIAPLLPITEKLNELFWSVGVIDDVYGDIDINGLENYNKIPKILDKLSLDEKNAILLATMMATMLQSSDYENEQIFIYRFFAELSVTLPDIFIMIYDSILPKITYSNINNQSQAVAEVAQSTIITIISRPDNDTWQNHPRRHQLINYLKNIGFFGLPESGLFTRASKPKKIELSQLACAIVEAIVS